MHVLIPAGGRGVRLRPLTTYCPKPLLPLGDRPILTRIVESLPESLPATVLVTPHLEGDFTRWRDALLHHRRVGIYVEHVGPEGPLGPVAALACCARELAIDDDLLIMMGDSLLPFTLEEFLEGAQADTPRLAAYPLPDLRDASRFGVVEIAADETVATFEEKPAQPRSSWVFTGCLFVPRRLLRVLRDMDPPYPSQMGDIVAGYVRQGERVEIYRVRGEWHDVGTFASYLRAHEALLSEDRRRSLLSQGNRLHGAVYVHPSATVTGSKLTDCLVFAGAKVVDAELTGCVVQPHVPILQRVIQGKLVTAASELPLGGE